MAKRKCLTPGADFFCRVTPTLGETTVYLQLGIPRGIVISKARAKAIEKAFHDSMEKTMAPWWPKVAARNAQGTP